jgi:hypothetical protein
MARPSNYNYDLCVEICSKVSEGDNIKSVLESKEEYPSFPTFCKWKRENEELFNLYINSHQDKAIGIEQEMDDLKDMLLTGKIDPSTYNTIVQTLKWKAAKFYAKVFGDNKVIDLTVDDKTMTPEERSKRISDLKDKIG